MGDCPRCRSLDNDLNISSLFGRQSKKRLWKLWAGDREERKGDISRYPTSSYCQKLELSPARQLWEMGECTLGLSHRKAEGAGIFTASH